MGGLEDTMMPKRRGALMDYLDRTRPSSADAESLSSASASTDADDFDELRAAKSARVLPSRPSDATSTGPETARTADLGLTDIDALPANGDSVDTELLDVDALPDASAVTGEDDEFCEI